MVRSLLIPTVAAHAATARDHASTTADYANDEEHDADNRESIWQIHVTLQEFLLREKALVFAPPPRSRLCRSDTATALS